MTKTMPNGAAPTGTSYNIGAKGGKVGQAWQMIWDRLDHDTYTDARDLADWAADKVGIRSVSLMSHIHRMAKEGVLDSTTAYADVTVHKFGREYASRRKRTHIRLPQDQGQSEVVVG
jgi:hypothetical protein